MKYMAMLIFALVLAGCGAQNYQQRPVQQQPVYDNSNYLLYDAIMRSQDRLRQQRENYERQNKQDMIYHCVFGRIC